MPTADSDDDCERICLPERRAASFIRQAAEALQYCHAQGVMHRDIKLENLLVRDADDSVLLCDFGLSVLTAPGVGLVVNLPA